MKRGLLLQKFPAPHSSHSCSSIAIPSAMTSVKQACTKVSVEKGARKQAVSFTADCAQTSVLCSLVKVGAPSGWVIGKWVLHTDSQNIGLAYLMPVLAGNLAQFLFQLVRGFVQLLFLLGNLKGKEFISSLWAYSLWFFLKRKQGYSTAHATSRLCLEICIDTTR